MSIGTKKQSAASVPTPAAGNMNYFTDSADDKFKKKDSTGTVTNLEEAAAGVATFEGRSGPVVSQAGDYNASEITNTPAGNIVGLNVQDAINELDAEKAPVSHVGAGGAEHALVTGGAAGFMSPSDKTKLDGVQNGATANDTDANLKNRANHTGTQPAGTITGLATVATTGLKADVGLGNVDNTSDMNKPVSTAQAAADAVIQADIDAHEANTSNPHSVTKSQVGLGNVDNTSDMDKPVSTAQAASIATKLTDPTTSIGDLIFRDALNQIARLPGGTDDFIFRMVGGIPAWVEENLEQDFGGGGNGDVTVSGLMTLTQATYYRNLTMVPGGVIVTNGYPLYCKKLDLINADVNAIRWNGSNGSSSTSATGAAGGTLNTAQMLGGSGGGGTGATSVANAVGAQAATPGNATPSNGGAGGAGGAGGLGAAGAGGASRAGGTVANAVVFDRFEAQFTRGASLVTGGAPGAGGSSGAGSLTQTGRGGGGGGAGGGVVVIYAYELVTGPSTPAGVIQSSGGNGGNCNGTPSVDAGGGAGGGGGGGGYVYLAYVNRTGTPVTNLIQANGGNGGNGGIGNGTGIAGNGGSGGSGGRIRVFDAKEATSVVAVIGTSGSAGTLGSGLIGGLGGAGGVAQATL